MIQISKTRLFIGLCIVIALSFFLFQKSCNKPIDTTKFVSIDSLNTVKAELEKVKSTTIDSSNAIIATKDSAIKVKDSALKIVSTDLKTSKSKIQKLQAAIDSGILINDTSLIVNNYNELKEEVATLEGNAEKQGLLYLSQVETYEQIIVEKDRIIASHVQYSSELNKLYSFSTEKLNETQKKLSSVQSKANKRVVLGIQVGYGFQEDLKPKPYIGIGLTYRLIRF